MAGLRSHHIGSGASRQCRGSQCVHQPKPPHCRPSSLLASSHRAGLDDDPDEFGSFSRDGGRTWRPNPSDDAQSYGRRHPNQ